MIPPDSPVHWYELQKDAFAVLQPSSIIIALDAMV
jgi:hypothetical protein